MNDFNFIPQGWECPKCKRVYSPTTIMCISCPTQTSITTTNTPIGIGGHGVANTNHVFVPDPITTSVCKVCGKDKSLHSLFNHKQ
jgi:rubredoxin